MCPPLALTFTAAAALPVWNSAADVPTNPSPMTRKSVCLFGAFKGVAPTLATRTQASVRTMLIPLVNAIDLPNKG